MRWMSPVGTTVLAALTLASPVCAIPTANGRTLQVGPGETFTLPSQAAAAVRDGDEVDIDAGTYTNDVAVWHANRLTLRGVGGRAILDSQGHTAERKAIWVIVGNGTTVENITFTGAAVPDHNGAGIRQEGSGLTVTACLFHDNEDGILANASPTSDILIQNTEFDHNGQGDGYSHNIYIGHVRTFTLRGCYSHNANAGHDVKSRAATNYILYNRISDDDVSNTSYLLNLPNGGASFVIGNIFRRGPNAGNGTLISYAEEGATNPQQALYVINNTFANDNARHAVTFVRAGGTPKERIVNDLFLGSGSWASGAGGFQSHDLAVTPADFMGAAAFNYRLAPHSKAINAGIAPGAVDGFELMPGFEYASPQTLLPRPTHGSLDVGAY